MTLSDLLEDVVGELPDDRRKMVEALVEEYGAVETCRFMLFLLAGADQRERRLARLLLNDLDRLETSSQSP